MAPSTGSEQKPAATDGRTGGTEGNERLTGSTGALLVVLLLIEGVTILSLSSLLPLHLFIGIVLIPPVLLKATSTGYRFVRYYTRNTPYVRKGPPPLLLRALGPVLLLSTGVLLTTGVALLAIGPGDGLVRNLHTWSFIVFAGAVSVHVLAHLRKVPALTTPTGAPARGCPGLPRAAACCSRRCLPVWPSARSRSASTAPGFTAPITTDSRPAGARRLQRLRYCRRRPSARPRCAQCALLGDCTHSLRIPMGDFR